MTSTTKQIIIHIITSGKKSSRVNYSRRMYAIIRRYTPNVTEGDINECFADITGLRTFFKMSYREMTLKILEDLNKEIGVPFSLKIATFDEYTNAKNTSKKVKSVSTFKEMNTLFAGRVLNEKKYTRRNSLRKIKLSVPFIGKVA